jgi:hypothetical protein
MMNFIFLFYFFVFVLFFKVNPIINKMSHLNKFRMDDMLIFKVYMVLYSILSLACIVYEPVWDCDNNNSLKWFLFRKSSK